MTTTLPAPMAVADRPRYLSQLEARMAAAGPYAPRSPNARKLNLLFVEDDLFTRQTIVLLMNDPRWILRFATTADEAVRHYANLPPHMVFLDIELPDASGLELLAMVNRVDAHACPIMLTGDTSASHVNYAKVHGARGYIAKPLNGQRLLECVHRYMGFLR